MTDDQQAFDAFLSRREAAARAYVRGDPAPLDRIVAKNLPASFFGPAGGSVRGTREVAAKYERDAALFGREGETRFEVFEAAAGDRIAYWTGLQHAEVHIGDDADARPMHLRVTEVFRREDNEWKLVHRHADPLTAERDGK